MKTRLFILLVALLPLYLWAGEVNDLSKLKTGDRINLLVTLPEKFTNYPKLWDVEDVTKIELEGRVFSMKDEKIAISFKPIHFYSNFQSKTQADRKKETGEGEYYYYDSYFSDQPDLQPLAGHSAGFGQRDSAFVVLDMKTGVILTSHYAENPYWDFQYQSIPMGVRKSSGQLEYVSSWLTLPIEVAAVLDKGVYAFFEHWSTNKRTGKDTEWMVDLREGDKPVDRSPVYVQVTSSSFSWPANVFVTYHSSDLLEKSHLQSVDRKFDYQFSQPDENKIECRFFLPSPQKITLFGSSLWLTPGDSLCICVDSLGNTTFSGQGAAASSFAQELMSHASFFYEDYTYMYRVPSPELFEERLEVGRLLFESLQERYGREMNAYWLRSSELAYHYWNSAIRLLLYATTTKRNPLLADQAFQIPWFGPSMLSLMPYTDYLYQPENYDKFLNFYFDYKASQLEIEALTSFKGSFSMPEIPTYYLQNAVLSGYPRFYLAAELLEEQLRSQHFYKIQREYDDYLDKCKDPILRNKLIETYNHLSLLEPGKNIKDLKLNIASSLPLKHKSDGYILLSIASYEPNVSNTAANMEQLKDSLSKAGLGEQLEVILVRPDQTEKQFAVYPALQPHLIYSTKDKLIEDECRYTGTFLQLLLIRNDGIIVSREINSLFLNEIDPSVIGVLIKLIRNDMNRPVEPIAINNSYQLSILLSSLISILLTALFVRGIIRRRERVKRYVSELELKAIRAQMNPHFIFNALGSIQNLINQKKDRDANEYLVNFSKLLRMVLSTSERRIIPLSEEIQQLELYLKLEQLRLPFQYTIEVDPAINTDNEEIPGMLIQPVVENAVIHGIQPQGGGVITVRFSLEEDYLNIEVRDSGNGFSGEKMGESKGFGLQSVRERLKLLKKELNMHIGFSIVNKDENGMIVGTVAKIVIPL